MEEYSRDSFRAIREQMEKDSRSKKGSALITFIIVLIFLVAGFFYIKTAQPQLYTKAANYIKSVAAKSGSLETISNALFDKASEPEGQTENTTGESGDMLQSAENLSFSYISQPIQYSVLDSKTLSLQSFVPVASASVTSSFGDRTDPVTGEVSAGHHGIDLAAAPGSEIDAYMSGTVTKVGKNSVYGNYVIIDHGSSLSTFYGHMSSVSVKEGQSIEGGGKIGIIGSTGKSTGVHLHFEVRIDGERVDPAPYIYETI